MVSGVSKGIRRLVLNIKSCSSLLLLFSADRFDLELLNGQQNPAIISTAWC